MVTPEVVTTVRKYFQVLEHNGIPVRFGVVYGSHATGKADKWSDIDLVVVSPEFDGEIEYADVARLWKLAGRTDSRIEPIPCGDQQWEQDDSSAIVEIARREGERITPTKLVE